VKLYQCREKRPRISSVMEDAEGANKGSPQCDLIQETGQEQRPARMVGLSSLDSVYSSKDAGWDREGQLLRRRGERW
jgi:hypothetical protein